MTNEPWRPVPNVHNTLSLLETKITYFYGPALEETSRDFLLPVEYVIC